MALANLSVRARLASLLVLVNVLVLGAVGYGAWSLSRAQDQLGRALDTQVRFGRLASHVDRAEIGFKMELLHFKNLLLRGSEDDLRRKHMKGRVEAGRQVTKDLEAARQLAAGLGTSSEGLAQLIAKHDELVKVYDGATDQYEMGSSPAVIETAMRGAFSTTSDRFDKLAEWLDAEGERVGREIAETSALEKRARQVELFAFAIAAILASVVGGWLIARSLIRPLGHAIATAQRVAAGDLSGSIPQRGGDEFGRLLASLQTMNGSLASVVSTIRTDANSLMSASAEIARGNQDLASRTEEQASSLEETAASIEEMSATVRQSAEHAQNAHGLARSMSQAVAEARGAVTDVVATMESIRTGSSKVADITSLIDSIAFQTNILALNAAVEAARAGDQGRGFAVVAAEVRSLAQRAGDAAKEIRDLTAASASHVADGVRTANHAGSSMAQVVTRVEELGGVITEIASASREHSAGLTQVNKAAASLETATQQNAALVQESAAASERLSQLARHMAEAVATFKLHEDAVAAEPEPRSAPALSFRSPLPRPALSSPSASR